VHNQWRDAPDASRSGIAPSHVHASDLAEASELYRASQAPSQILGLLHVICEDLPGMQALSNTSNIKHATQVKRPLADMALSGSRGRALYGF